MLSQLGVSSYNYTFGEYMKDAGLVGLGAEDPQDMVDIYSEYEDAVVINTMNAEDGEDTNVTNYPVTKMIYNDNNILVFTYI